MSSLTYSEECALLRRIVGMHVVEQALDQQHVVDGAQALGAFGRGHPFRGEGAIGMGDARRTKFSSLGGGSALYLTRFFISLACVRRTRS